MQVPFAHATLHTWKRISIIAGCVAVFLLISGLLTYSHFFGPVDQDAELGEFIVRPDMSIPELAADAKTQGLVRSTLALRIALYEEADGRPIRPGGYTVGKGMDTWTVAKILSQPPALAFVTFPPAIRKEQMGDILAEALSWSEEQLHEWNTIATESDPDFTEGVYYPDTYLIPSDQTPTQIAARMRGRFTDMFAPYAQEALEQNIPWTKVLILASIVDREAGKTDKPLVAGILWNRLNIGMKLQADATLQYVKGTQGNWWPQPLSADKYLDSAFNTYKHAGLPPHPIDNPSLASIDAVLHPDDTNCLFYLHDAQHEIHCSVTYAGQVKNVDRYLR